MKREYKEIDPSDNSYKDECLCSGMRNVGAGLLVLVCCSGETTTGREGLMNSKTQAQGMLSYNIF
jgi:hypothetical protein